MSTRWRTIIALAIAFSVFAILVSPYAASELTTLRSPHKVIPPAMALPIALVVLLGMWNSVPTQRAWEASARLAQPGSEVVALTCAWLC